MGFGFVVARFGLFLQQFQLIQHAPSAPSYGLSLWFGTALIAVGVVVNLSSAWHHTRLARALDHGEPPRCSPWPKRRGSSSAGAGRTRNGDLSGLRTRFCES
jgi:putative membrane protein